MFNKIRRGDHFWALACVGIVAVAALVLGAAQFARQSDLVAKEREEAVVRSGFLSRMREVEGLIVANAVWDDAVRNLDNHFSAAWAQENVGSFFYANGNFQFAYVLGAGNQTLYGMRDSETVTPESFAPIAGPAATLIQEVRQQEAVRGHAAASLGFALQNPIQRSNPVWLDDRLFIVTATLVQSDFGRAQISQNAAPIIVTGREIDDAFMASFGDRYMLEALHLHQGDSRFEPNEAHAAIFNREGEEIATLDWIPQTPGAKLLNAVFPWILGFVAILLGATLLLYSRARRHQERLQDSEKRSLHIAYHDALTGISNRMHFEERLVDAVVIAAKTGAAFAVHCVDLDRFKELNDTFGPQVGDELLKMAAHRLRDTCGPMDVCSRLGGDEFAVLQVINDQSDARALSDKITKEFSNPFELSIGTRSLSASVGISVSDNELHEPLEMLRRAQMALYRAKNEGRGCSRFYNVAMDDLVKAMRRLKDDLRADLAAGKLSMVYQPQVRRSGEVVGLEALVRWTHSEQGPISPAVFVPLAEEAGLIGALGEFTLRQAAIDSLRWPHLKVAVNVSATQIQDPKFVERAKEIISEVGADRRDVEIELTEGVFFGNEEQTRSALLALHEAGFSIALDDFGTGYSSLSYLQRFPIDKIKIDRSFVVALGKDPKADALFSAIVRLATALDMRVIAEGVETDEQWSRLSNAGCPKISGIHRQQAFIGGRN